MKKLSVILAITAAIVFSGCNLLLAPGADPAERPHTTATPEPPGLSAWEAWVCFQLNTGGENGDLYSLSANSAGKLNRQGMITDNTGYWSLTYTHMAGRQYQSGTYAKDTHTDNLGTYTPLNRLLDVCDLDEYDSYEAIQIADANGGNAYSGIDSLTLASGNGGIFGYAGKTLWVIVYQPAAGTSPERWFLIDAQTGAFIKRFQFL